MNPGQLDSDPGSARVVGLEVLLGLRAGGCGPCPYEKWGARFPVITQAWLNASGVPGTARQVIALLNRACEYLSRAEGGARGLALAQSTVKRATRVLGAEHPDTLIARFYEAFAYQRTTPASQAVTLLEPPVADCERILGAEYPTTLSTRHELAVAYQATGRVLEAIAIYEPLLTQQERILGAEHPTTLSTRNNPAGSYLDAGRVADAIAILQPLLVEREPSGRRSPLPAIAG